MKLFLLHVLYFDQITIDTSPPHTGIVQDGIRGTAEVDFQQSIILQAHWDGFFDRESGVLFYQYGFHTEPISSEDFLSDTGNHLVCFKGFSYIIKKIIFEKMKTTTTL